MEILEVMNITEEENSILKTIVNIEGIERLVHINPLANEQLINIFYYYLPKIIKPRILSLGQIKTIYIEYNQCLDNLSQYVTPASLAMIHGKIIDNINTALELSVKQELFEQAHNLKQILELYDN
jgi:hypothetical protein